MSYYGIHQGQLLHHTLAARRGADKIHISVIGHMETERPPNTLDLIAIIRRTTLRSCIMATLEIEEDVEKSKVVSESTSSIKSGEIDSNPEYERYLILHEEFQAAGGRSHRKLLRKRMSAATILLESR